MPGTIRPPSLDDEIEAQSPGPPAARSGAVPVLASAKPHPPMPMSGAVSVQNPAVGGRGSRADIAVGHAVTNYAPATGRVTQPSLTSSPNMTAKVCPECGLHYPAEFKVCPRDASELAEVLTDAKQDELVGQVLGGTFTIVRVIGEGGMGRVYEARHNRIATKRFAVKILHPEFARQPEVITRFQREAEAAAAIDSPHVVGVFDVDRSADGRPYLVAEYLEGKEFADYLTVNGKMNVPQAVRIVRQICKALAAAHKKGVVHRDMKPENVFLTGDLTRPIAKVIDFGISKVGDSPGTALTKTGMIMGTPSYMAPEQARGDKVDHRADVYAVGAILYCALTGQRPFDHGDPTVTLTAVLTRDPPRPRSIEESIPEALEMVVQRAMSKVAKDRHASMEDLDAELAPFDVGDPASGLALTSVAPMAKNAGQKQAREVAMARPVIVLMSAIGLAMTLSLLLTAITAVVRKLRGSGPHANITSSEAIILILGVGFTLLTPGILIARSIKIKVWSNTAQAVSLAEQLRRPVITSLCAYGFAALLIRVLDGVVLQHSAAVAWPVWDFLLFGVSVAGAIAGWAMVDFEAKR